jgi:hypothetical protein
MHNGFVAVTTAFAKYVTSSIRRQLTSSILRVVLGFSITKTLLKLEFIS